MTKQPYKAYASANLTVAKTRQIVMLYEAAIRNVQQARDAIERKDIETRYKTITKAANIMFGLQGCLDFEQGGEVAKTLYSFYASMDARLLAIHRSNSVTDCEQLIKELKMMKEAWDEIDKNLAETAAIAPAPAEKQLATPQAPEAPTGNVAISA